MAHLLPPSRTGSLLSSSVRSRLNNTQPCSFQLPRQSVCTSIFEASASTATRPTPESSFGLRKNNGNEQLETTKQEKTNRPLSRQASKPPIVRQAPKLTPNASKVQATTWDGLEWVGSRKYIWENAAPASTQRWGPKQATSPDKLESQLLCALVETLLVFNGEARPGYDIHTLPKHDQSSFSRLFPSGISVIPAQNGNPKLVISSDHRQAILNRQTILPEELGGIPSEVQEAKGSYKSWQEVPLRPLSMRFTFLKRVLQRTGYRIPDSSIAECKNAGALERILRKQRDATRKLAQELEEGGAFGLIDRSNVDFKPKRVTKVDRDMTVGRWKLTREELAKAGLPEFWAATLPPLNERRRMTVQPKSIPRR